AAIACCSGSSESHATVPHTSLSASSERASSSLMNKPTIFPLPMNPPSVGMTDIFKPLWIMLMRSIAITPIACRSSGSSTPPSCDGGGKSGEKLRLGVDIASGGPDGIVAHINLFPRGDDDLFAVKDVVM